MIGKYYYGTGRRKTSTARVYLHEGTGLITINSRDVDNFVQSKALKSYLMAPLQKSELENKVDLKASAKAKLIAGEALTEDEANTIVL